MSIQIRATQLFVRNLTLRVPFRYGIATMTRVPHLVVRVEAEIDGVVQRGFAADNLPPKWFTKNPQTEFRQEIAEMIEVTEAAARGAQAMDAKPSVYDWWCALSEIQHAWGEQRGLPPLLFGFGVSLIERALIDAFCRATGQTFAHAISRNSLGVRLGELHSELGSAEPAEFLPPRPAREMVVRHTVGMTDALTDAEVSMDAPHDGLPHSLEDFIRTHGLTHFKIKLSGDAAADRDRLRRIAEVVGRRAQSCAFTLDGNENFRSVAPFRALWQEFQEDPSLAAFLQGLIFVEQPFHRDVALSAATTSDLLAWEERPPIIIDESDSGIDCLPVALAGGYAGTSHKNCKGVIHGLVNACLIEHRRRGKPARPLHISAEDLTNLGPIALTQDLTVAAVLGITHAERNGHHYFAGLSQFPSAIQKAVLHHHGELFMSHSAGFPTAHVEDGRMKMGSVLDAPFGVGFEPDLAEFTPVQAWRFETL